MPLANTYILDYTLECLTASGVKEIYVFCTSHPEMVIAHLEASKWMRASSRVRVEVIVNVDCITAGDALRDVNERQIMSEDDFVLVAGDVVSNLDLAPILAAHKERRANKIDCIMTSVYKRVDPDHRTRSYNDDVVIGLNAESGEIVYFDSETESKRVDLDAQLLLDVPDLELRHDLLDTRIDICSPTVLHLFTDNWDYGQMRTDFVTGILSSEIFGHKIYAHIVRDQYAARVQCFKTYAAVSKDVIHRWTFPVTPDANFMDQSSYRHYRNNVYRESNVTLHRSSHIGSDTVVGTGSVISEGASVSGSIIGRNCSIGPGAVIRDSYIWDSVSIEAGATIDSAIVASGAVIKSNAIVCEDCVISYNVVIGPNHIVSRGTRVTTAPETSPARDTDSASLGGSESGGDLAASPSSLSSSPMAAAFLARGGAQLAFPSDDLGPGGVGRIYKGERDGGQAWSLFGGSRGRSLLDSDDESDSGLSDGSLVENYNEMEHFSKEIVETILRGNAENHSIDNVVLEVNSLKFAFDRTLSDVCNCVLPTILSFIDTSDPIASSKDVISSRWAPLLEKYAHGREEQIELLITLQHYAVAHADFRIVFHIVLQLMFEADVLAKENILHWRELLSSAEDEHAEDPEVVASLLDKASKFLTWLESYDGSEYEYDYSEDDDE